MRHGLNFKNIKLSFFKAMILLHLYEILEKATLIYSDRRQISGCLNLGSGGRVTIKGNNETFWSE